MAGSKREKSPGVWELRVSAGRNGRTGQYEYVSRTFHGTAKAAGKELAALVTEVGKQGTVDRKRVTVAQLLDLFLDDCMKRRRSPTTTRRYRSLIRLHISPAIGHIRIDRLTPFDLEQFYGAMEREGGQSSASVRQAHAILRRALKLAIRWRLGGLRENVALEAEPPALVSTPKRMPTVEQVKLFLTAAEAYDQRLAVFVWLAAFTGARRGEICGLRWTDLNPRNATLTIERSIAPNDTEGLGPEAPKTVVKDTKTHQGRTVSLDAPTMAVLAFHRERMEGLAEEAGGRLPVDAWIFSADPLGGTWMYPDSINTALTRVIALAAVVRAVAAVGGIWWPEVVRIMPHTFRHFMATMAIGANADIRTVAGRLGHSDPNVTLRIYAHYLEARDRDVADKMGDLFKQDPPKALGA